MEKTGYKDYFSAQFYFADKETKALSVLNIYMQNKTDFSDINKVLELYNVKVFLEDKNNVPMWTEEAYKKYKVQIKDIIKRVREFYDTITEENIVSIYHHCNEIFWDDFWLFFFKFGTYKIINNKNMVQIIQDLRVSPYIVLKDKEFVAYFDDQITELLKLPEYGARVLINFYLKRHEEPIAIYLPKGLSVKDKYDVMTAYIDGEAVSVNDLDLIINSRPVNKDFFIDDRLRYKARKKYQKIWSDPKINVMKYQTGINVSFGPELPETSLKYVDGNIIAEYNLNWIKNNLDYPTLLNNFIYLFGYTDLYMRCTLVSVPNCSRCSNLFMVNGNAMYHRRHSFEISNYLADAQIGCYMNVLEREKVFLENIVKWFFEKYLQEEFNVKGFICNVPEHNAPILDKCKLLASAMDGIAKQYKLYWEDGEIDRELFEMSSGQVIYKGLPSFIHNKYGYAASNELNMEINMLFSNQNALSYIEKGKSKYHTLYELLKKENVTKSEFSFYQQESIDWLIERKTLIVDKEKIKLNYIKAYILKQLYDRGVLCLQYFQSSVLRNMIAVGDVRVTSTLLSEPEYKYFNYILNKKEFSNGLDLRNKYVHDTGPINIEQQQEDYTILMKLMVVLMIKINEEFCLKDKLKESKDNFYDLK